MEPYEIENDNNIETKKTKGTKMTSIFAIILGIIPYLLYFFCMIKSEGSFSEADSGAIWWLLIIYYWTVGFPILIASIVNAIISILATLTEKKDIFFIFSIIALILDLIPVILFIINILL